MYRGARIGPLNGLTGVYSMFKYRVFQNGQNETVLQRCDNVGRVQWLIFNGNDAGIEAEIRSCQKRPAHFDSMYVLDGAESYQNEAVYKTLSNEYEDVTNYYFGNNQG